jgi:hypothetical protein
VLPNSLESAFLTLFVAVLRLYNFFAASCGVVSAVGGCSGSTGAGDVTCGK